MSSNRSATMLDMYNHILDTITSYITKQLETPLQRDKTIIFNDAKRSLNSILSASTNIQKNQLTYLEFKDIIISMAEINAIFEEFNNNPDSVSWKNLIADFLKRRAERVLNGPLCYTVIRPYAMNDICISLARLCDPTATCSLLMPTVSKEDIYGNRLDELSLGQFILSDDKTTFINLNDVIETAFTRSLASEDNIYLTTTASGAARPLSPTEMRRLGSLRHSLDKICGQFREKGFFKRFLDRNKDTLYNELVALRNGLRAGDVLHGGEEMSAGAAANQAIVQFREYYESLSKTRQAQISAYTGNGRTLGQIFDVIFRDPEQAAENDGSAVIYCMYLVGDQLEHIITENKQRLLNQDETKQECIERLKNKLLQDIQFKRYQNLDVSTIPPLSLQLTSFMEALQVIPRNHPSQARATDILFRMATFIAGECQRYLTTNNFGDKLNYFANLLFAIANELTSLENRSRADIELLLNETCKRITHLVSCPSTYVHFSQPASKTNWRKWLSENAPLLSFQFDLRGETEAKSLNIYLLRYPIDTQRAITSEEIINLRAREAHEIDLVKNAIEHENQLKEFRANSPLSFFYKHPATTSIAVTTVAAASTALLTYRLIS